MGVEECDQTILEGCPVSLSEVFSEFTEFFFAEPSDELIHSLMLVLFVILLLLPLVVVLRKPCLVVLAHTSKARSSYLECGMAIIRLSGGVILILLEIFWDLFHNLLSLGFVRHSFRYLLD